MIGEGVVKGYVVPMNRKRCYERMDVASNCVRALANSNGFCRAMKKKLIVFLN